jgi:hypothetical protein
VIARRTLTARRTLSLAAVVVGLLVFPAGAAADFGFEPGSVAVEALQSNGAPVVQASSHPYDYVVRFNLNAQEDGFGEGGDMRDVIVDLPRGFVGNPLAAPRCPRQEFEGFVPHCPPDTQVGVLRARGFGTLNKVAIGPLYNIVPPPGTAAQIGFSVANSNALQNAFVRSEEGYGLRIGAFNIPTALVSVSEEIWGVPAEPSHDAQRGQKAAEGSGPPVASDAPLQAFLTMPAECQGSLQEVTLRVDSKLNPGVFTEQTVNTTDAGGYPVALSGCEAVPFGPRISAAPTSKLAENPSGLGFVLNLPNQGLTSPSGIAETEPSKVQFALPEGVTLNPSAAEGLVGCSSVQYSRETVESAPGVGCPEGSKLGSVAVRSPLLEESLEGAVYLASPYDNPFNSLVALYLVARAPQRGIIVKQAGKVDLDPSTGQIVTTFEGLPPIPFSSFKLNFREGGRAPLVTPPNCGEFKSNSQLYPFSTQTEATTVAAPFQIERGAEGGACPSGGTPPFHPTLTAGSINSAAGRYSPFNIRITRTDAEQEITHFSIKLPPGVTGKLAGIPFCSDQQITAARSRERQPHGGQEEIEHPSCPAASEVGHTLVGAGVGNSLTYVPGKVYLAGPYQGSNLSIVAITAAEAGPFDLGTVVIREALKVNPETAEVSVDGGTSDPIPHIIDGVPVHLRDIRVYVDRPEFALNPTNCTPTSTASTVLGSGTNFASEADDRPVTVTSRFQAADCASLGFKPGLKISLKGPTKRAGLPALTAVVTPRAGDANIGRAVVTLPPSEFLEQGHIGNSCTRVQFNSGAGNGAGCPANSVLGHAVAVTPLLGEPLEGPVFLRSNGGERKLPDLVAALHSTDINIDLVGFIDSLHKKGSESSQIRTTFAAVPDQPVTRFTLQMFGGKKGLLVNSTNLCKGSHKAISEFVGQNGKRSDSEPPVKTQCKKKGRKSNKAGKKSKPKPKTRSARALLVPGWAAW